jgi:anti-sigma B factor antagonist
VLDAVAHFEARSSTEPGQVIVALAGECDLAAQEELTSVLMAAVRRADTVLVDAGELTFLDSSGIHGLLTAYHAAEKDGRKLYLTAATGVVADVLDMTGVAALLSPPTHRDGPAAGSHT